MSFTWTFESLKQLMSAEFSFQSSSARTRERERVLVVVHSVVVVAVVFFVVVVFRRSFWWSRRLGIERPLAALLIRRFPDVVERPHFPLCVLLVLLLFCIATTPRLNGGLSSASLFALSFVRVRSARGSPRVAFARGIMCRIFPNTFVSVSSK